MTELEKKAEAYVSEKADKGNFDVEKFGKAYFSESSMKQALVKFAEPREKRIEELEKENEQIKSTAEFQQSSNMKRYFEIQELEKKNAQLRADYEKQKEINKELADDIGALQDELKTAKEYILAANKAYDALAAQIRQANEREAQDIRARFPC